MGAGPRPAAARWAEQFADACPPTVGGFRRFGAPLVVRTAVEGITQACLPDPDRLLRDLLRTTIEDCAAWIGGRARRPGRGAGQTGPGSAPPGRVVAALRRPLRPGRSPAWRRWAGPNVAVTVADLFPTVPA